jgi:transcriptional regulator with XRE-family HTH domain
MRLFGLRVRELRRIRGLTQERLAELAQLSPREMQRLEAGEANVSLTKIAQLAHVLQYAPMKLFIPPKATIRRVGRPPKS